MTAAQAIALLGPACTIAQADRRLTCKACSARGRHGFIQARFDPPAIDAH